MKARWLILGTSAAAASCALMALPRRHAVSMHELDWPDRVGAGGRRRYRSPGHMLYHLWELAGLALPVFEVYVLRALSPAFREKIMIITAMADDCSA